MTARKQDNISYHNLCLESRYLVHLGWKGDPAWECLENQQKWITQLLTECTERNIQEPEETGTGQRLSAGNIASIQAKPYVKGIRYYFQILFY